MGFTFEDMVSCPSRSDCADDCEDLEHTDRPCCILNAHVTGLGEEFGTPVKNTHAHHIHKDVGDTESPDPTVGPYHDFEELLAGSRFLTGCLAHTGLCAGELGKTDGTRVVAQTEVKPKRTAYRYAGRNPEAIFPSVPMLGVAHDCLKVVGIKVKVCCDFCNYAVVRAEVCTHCAHDVSAYHDSEGCTDGVGCVPYRHLCGKLRRVYPAGEKACARRITYALEKLIADNCDCHHHHKHVNEVRTRISAGDPAADVYSETEGKV